MTHYYKPSHKNRSLSKRHYSFYQLYWKHANLWPCGFSHSGCEFPLHKPLILQTEGIDVICRPYEDHYAASIICQFPQTIYQEFLRLILKENSFKFNERHFIQTHGVTMGAKTAAAFSVIFKADLEKRLLMANPFKPLVRKRFFHDIFSLWDISMKEV